MVGRGRPLRQAGCDEVIDYRGGGNLLAEDLTVDVWFDVVGHHSLRAVRHQMAAAREQVVLNIVKLVSTSVSSWFKPMRHHYEPAGVLRKEAALSELRTLIDHGRMPPVIEVSNPLDRIGAAFERSTSQRTVGKLVISMVD